MPIFIADTSNAEVNGETVHSVVDGMGSFKHKALEILEKNDIKDPRPGMWFLQQNWLNAFKEISLALGPNTLYSIGLKIPENAQFPPQINNLVSALESIDIAYHMNHGINGIILFNSKTGVISEGIGHYTFKKIEDKKVK